MILSASNSSALAVIIIAIAYGNVSIAATGASQKELTEAERNRRINIELDSVDEKLQGLFGKMDFINNQYIVPQSKVDVEHFNRRLSRAEVLLGLGDSSSAAVLLYELVETPDNIRMPGYSDAMFILADILFNEKNYYCAREYYKTLLEGGRDKYYRTSLKRLIEIASLTGNYDNLDSYYKLANNLDSSMLSSEVNYYLGKGLFQKGDISRAIDTFKLVKNGSDFYLRARYFIVAINVREGKFDNAISEIDRMLKSAPVSSSDPLIMDLAYMAKARILYEEGKYIEAVDAYQHIDSNSAVFEEAVYEMSWIYIRQKEYQKALQSLNILLMSDKKEDPVLVKAEILRGHLLLNKARFSEAQEVFKTIIDTYEPLQSKLRLTLSDFQGPVKFYQNIAGNGLEKVEAQKDTPEIVIRWTSSENEVSEAFSIVKELKGSSNAIDESIRIADKIITGLGSENRVNMFPLLKEARIKGMSVKSELDEIRGRLAKIEETVIGEILNEDERGQLKEARRLRDNIQKQIDDMPTNEEGYKKRSIQSLKRVQKVEREMLNMSIDLDGMKAQMEAIGKWFFDTKGMRNDDPGQDRIFHEKMNKEWEQINELSTQLKREMVSVDNEKVAMGIVSEINKDEKIRQSYRDALDAERKLMDRARNKLGSEKLKIEERIDALDSKTKILYVSIGKYEVNLEKAASIQANDLREKVLLEKRILKLYQDEVGNTQAGVENVAGHIAFNGFKNVYKKVSDLVTGADVGLMDTIWGEKEDDSKKIMRLQTDLNREMKALSDELSEVSK